MMKNPIKAAGIILALFTNIINISSQDLNMQETIDYINEKINSNKQIMEDNNAKYFWEVSADGKLTITRFVTYNVFHSSQSVFIKSLDADKVQIIDDIQTAEYYLSIRIPCKGNKEDVTRKWDACIKKSSGIYFRIGPDPDIARKLKNAIIYLIKLGEKNPDYKIEEKDPFDY